MQKELDGAWELLSGQPLPEGAKDIKILTDGHFLFTAYDTGTGKPLYTAGGTYRLDGNAYTEHLDFASATLAPELVGKDQHFTVEWKEDEFVQTGTLTSGKPLAETWKRLR